MRCSELGNVVGGERAWQLRQSVKGIPDAMGFLELGDDPVQPEASRGRWLNVNSQNASWH